MPKLQTSCAVLLAGVALVSPDHGSSRSIAYLAPAGYCRGEPVDVMICLHNYARRQAGVPALRPSARLAAAANAKSADIARCGLSHTACGHPFPYRIGLAGYRWRLAGENLAYRTGALRQPYAIFSGWLRSSEHQANILRRGFRDVGIALRTGSAAGHASGAIWVTEFGSH
jgi:uncharacterized protein YkwD